MGKVRPAILVGHCFPDAQMQRNAISRAVPHAQVAVANETHVLEECLSGECVLLINRELDGDYPVRYGVDLIKELSKRDNPPTMMLISNFDVAQEHAIHAGAVPGFGKSAVYSDSTAEILRDAMIIKRDRPETAAW